MWELSSTSVILWTYAFQVGPLPGWERVRHVGPSLEDEKRAIATTLPWPDTDTTPLVLMSFSTGFEQRNVEKLQRGLDALKVLPVHVVATTGGIVGPGELIVPHNAIAVSYAAHDPIIARAALVVTHGGHGTAMRSLRHGVPMVVIPGLAGDQPYVAAAVQEWGAGRALPGDADMESIRSAAQEVLSVPSYRAQAGIRAKALAGIDGAARAADEVEMMLSSSRPRAASAARVPA